MSFSSVEDHGTLLKTFLSVPMHQLDSCIYCVCSEPKKGLKNIYCDFFLIRCTADDIREMDLLMTLRNLIIKYSLKKEEYDQISPDNALEIVNKAKGRFVKSDGSGEVGELILFALLESFKNAPQILNKMSLKTNRNVHYHGLDAIHLGVDGDNFVLYYGEAKVRGDHKRAIQDASDN